MLRAYKYQFFIIIFFIYFLMHPTRLRCLHVHNAFDRCTTVGCVFFKILSGPRRSFDLIIILRQSMSIYLFFFQLFFVYCLFVCWNDTGFALHISQRWTGLSGDTRRHETDRSSSCSSMGRSTHTICCRCTNYRIHNKPIPNWHFLLKKYTTPNTEQHMTIRKIRIMETRLRRAKPILN